MCDSVCLLFCIHLRRAMKEACNWLSSNCQPKDILMKWSPLSLAVGWVLSNCYMYNDQHNVCQALYLFSICRLLKTASEFPSGSDQQVNRHPVSDVLCHVTVM